jgi:hypothetical protein
MNSIIELLTRTLCDIQPSSPTNGAYLYCQTVSNHESTFQSATSLLNSLLISKIFILQIEAKSGYTGYDNWKHQLNLFGIAEDQIEGVNLKSAMLNTLTESEALVQFAKQRSHSSLFVIAPPFHQLRVFMTAVTVALNVYPKLKIYSFPGTAMPWNENVLHSQGVLKAKRRQLIQTELERITKYQNKGDLASTESVLNYLNNRDKVS